MFFIHTVAIVISLETMNTIKTYISEAIIDKEKYKAENNNLNEYIKNKIQGKNKGDLNKEIQKDLDKWIQESLINQLVSTNNLKQNYQLINDNLDKKFKDPFDIVYNVLNNIDYDCVLNKNETQLVNLVIRSSEIKKDQLPKDFPRTVDQSNGFEKTIMLFIIGCIIICFFIFNVQKTHHKPKALSI